MRNNTCDEILAGDAADFDFSSDGINVTQQKALTLAAMRLGISD